MSDTRTKNTKRNLFWGSVSKLVGLILPFVTRTVMIHTLGMRYVGLDSLFVSVLGVLSLAELGFGSALVFSMYKPMAEHDVTTINALLLLYRKCYFVIGTVILILGICILPFLDIFVSGEVPREINLKVLFLVQLFNTVIGYYLFAYKNSIFQAQQRLDFSQKIAIAMGVILNVIRLCALIICKNYYIYILAGPVATMVQNILIALLARKYFPQFYCEGKINAEAKREIWDKVSGLIFQKIGTVVLTSVDTIVISSFLGLEVLGVYNGYYYIIKMLGGFIAVIQEGLIPSIGNSMVMESKEKNYKDFQKFHVLIIWLLTWWSTCMLCLYQPFIIIWQGEKNTLSLKMVVLFSLYFYLYQAGKTVYMYRTAAGLWRQGRYCSLMAALVNLILNIILVQIIGLPGILISTIIAFVTVNIPYGSWILFKYYFASKKKYFLYLKEMVVYFVFAVFVAGIVFGICTLLPIEKPILQLIAYGGICAVLPNLLFCVLHYKDNNFKKAVSLLTDMIPKR